MLKLNSNISYKLVMNMVTSKNNIRFWIDFYSDPKSDFSITLVLNDEDDIIAYANNLSCLNDIKKSEDPIHVYKFIDGVKVDYEYDEVLLAQYGKEVSFALAAEYFPFLTKKEFWERRRYKTYSHDPYQNFLA